MPSVCVYNGGMNRTANITDTQFFDSLLGDTMPEQTFSILNPYTGKPIIEQVPASKLDAFVAYFQNLTGVEDLPILKESAALAGFPSPAVDGLWDRYISKN